MEPKIIAELVGYMVWVAGLRWYEPAIPQRLPDWWRWGCPFFVFGERLESADRKRISRAVESLAREGSIERVSRGNGSKTTHIRPTRDLLRTLIAKADADLAESLRESLRRSRWGQEILNELDGG